MTRRSGPITVTIGRIGAARAGGVVSDWLIDVAPAVPAIWPRPPRCPASAQRTGATIYYLEVLSASPVLPADQRRPIFALMPNPGDVDVVIASENHGGRPRHAARTGERARTTLIASSHRILRDPGEVAHGRRPRRFATKCAR